VERRNWERIGIPTIRPSGDKFQFASVHFDGDTLHDLIKAQYNLQVILLAKDDAFKPLKHSGYDAGSLANDKVLVRLNVALIKPVAQNFNLSFRQLQWFLSRPNDREHSWSSKNRHALSTSDANEDIVRK